MSECGGEGSWGRRHVENHAKTYIFCGIKFILPVPRFGLLSHLYLADFVEIEKVSNTEHFDDEMDYVTDDDDFGGAPEFGKKEGKVDVRRGIDDYFEMKRQRDEDDYLFDD